MKKIILLIVCLLFVVNVNAQTNIWRYSEVGTVRTGYTELTEIYQWITTGADSVTSMNFGPRNMVGLGPYQGLLGIATQVDTFGTVAADTITFKLTHDLGVGQVVEPALMTWKNANDSTETTTQIILPADDGKIWIWQSNPTTHYLQKFPGHSYIIEMFCTNGDTIKVEQEYFIY